MRHRKQRDILRLFGTLLWDIHAHARTSASVRSMPAASSLSSASLTNSLSFFLSLSHTQVRHLPFVKQSESAPEGVM